MNRKQTLINLLKSKENDDLLYELQCILTDTERQQFDQTRTQLLIQRVGSLSTEMLKFLLISAIKNTPHIEDNKNFVECGLVNNNTDDNMLFEMTMNKFTESQLNDKIEMYTKLVKQEELESEYNYINLWNDEYRNIFHITVLGYTFKYNYYITELEQCKILRFVFNDVVNFILESYEKWEEDHIKDGIIIDYKDANCVNTYIYSYNTKNALYSYIDENYYELRHNSLRQNSSTDIEEFKETCLQYINNCLQIDSNSLSSFRQLLERLFTNQKIKIVHQLHDRVFIQKTTINNRYHSEKLCIKLEISRDYYDENYRHMIKNYISMPNTFEYKYDAEFKLWYDNVILITNNFDEITMLKHFSVHCEREHDELFKIPFHKNNILVDHLIKKYELRDIPQVSMSVKYNFVISVDESKQVVCCERSFSFKGDMFMKYGNSQEYDDSWCLFEVRECTVQLPLAGLPIC